MADDTITAATFGKSRPMQYNYQMNDKKATVSLSTPTEAEIAELLKSLRTGDLLALGSSPLAYTPFVEECFLTGEPLTEDGRGRILASLLRWAIERLRPTGETSWIKPAWRNYNILYHFYLEGARASTLAEKMVIAEQTLYQLRAQAIIQLTAVLRRELRAPEHQFSRKQLAHRDRYERLPAGEQQLVRIGAVFAGAAPSRLIFTLAQELGNADAPALIQQLVLKHLVRSNEQGSEFVVHPEIRPLLLPQLLPEERTVTHRTAAEHYSAQGDPLEAAQQWRAAEEPAVAAQLVIDRRREIIDNLQVDELASFIGTFVASELNADLWARLKILAGELAEFMGNGTAALTEYQQALAAPDRHTKALAYYRRARAFEQSNSDESLAHYARCIQLLEEATPQAMTKPDRTTLLCNVYIDRAWLQMQVRNELSRAEADLHRARLLLDRAPALRDRPIWSDLHNALGEYYHRCAQPELAVEHSWQAWLAANEVGDLERMSKTAHNLGLVYMDNLRQYDRALEYLHKSEELAQRTGNRQMAGLSAMSIGACCYWLDDRPRAIQQYETAEAIFRESSNQALLARALYGLAEAYAELDDQSAARRYYEEGLAVATALGDQGALHEFAQLAQQQTFLTALPGHETAQLSPRQEQALDYIRQQGQITNRDYQRLTGISQKQAVRDLNDLVVSGLLQRCGRGRSTHYRLDG